MRRVTFIANVIYAVSISSSSVTALALIVSCLLVPPGGSGACGDTSTYFVHRFRCHTSYVIRHTSYDIRHTYTTVLLYSEAILIRPVRRVKFAGVLVYR